MNRRWIRAFVLAVLIHGLASCHRDAVAQDGDGCEALERSTLLDALERFSLDVDQRIGLLDALEAGRLTTPEAFGTVPGLDAERAEALAATFCWGPSWSGDIVLRSRWRENGPRNEFEGRLERGGLRVQGRARRDPDRQWARGAVAWEGGRWSLLAGTIRARRGLGLGVASAGAGLRDPVPLTGSSGPVWRISLAAAEPSTRGVAMEWRGPGTRVALAWIDPATGFGSTVEVAWTFGGLESGIALIGDEAVSVRLQPEGELGDWCLEWVRTRHATATAGTWRRSLGSWRFRVGWSRVGAGFGIPGHARFSRPDPDEILGVRGELRWQPAPGRHLRIELLEDREPGSPGTEITRTAECELRETLRRGWNAGVLWRRRSREPLGTVPGRDLDLGRLVLELQRSPWRGRLQWETRWEPGGATRSLGLRGGRGRDSAWELRVARVEPDPGSEGTLSWYRRRAGGQYGWDRLPAGTWVGIWGRWAGRRGQVEASVDRRSGGWDGAFSIRFGVG